MPGQRDVGARQNHRRPMIATHGVDCDANSVRHGSASAAPWRTPENRSWGCYARGRPYPLGHGRQDGWGSVSGASLVLLLGPAGTLFERFQHGKGVFARVLGLGSGELGPGLARIRVDAKDQNCLLYTSDAADDLLCVD